MMFWVVTCGTVEITLQHSGGDEGARVSVRHLGSGVGVDTLVGRMDFVDGARGMN